MKKFATLLFSPIGALFVGSVLGLVMMSHWTIEVKLTESAPTVKVTSPRSAKTDIGDAVYLFYDEEGASTGWRLVDSWEKDYSQNKTYTGLITKKGGWPW